MWLVHSLGGGPAEMKRPAMVPTTPLYYNSRTRYFYTTCTTYYTRAAAHHASLRVPQRNSTMRRRSWFQMVPTLYEGTPHGPPRPNWRSGARIHSPERSLGRLDASCGTSKPALPGPQNEGFCASNRVAPRLRVMHCIELYGTTAQTTGASTCRYGGASSKRVGVRPPCTSTGLLAPMDARMRTDSLRLCAPASPPAAPRIV